MKKRIGIGRISNQNWGWRNGIEQWNWENGSEFCIPISSSTKPKEEECKTNPIIIYSIKCNVMLSANIRADNLGSDTRQDIKLVGLSLNESDTIK